MMNWSYKIHDFIYYRLFPRRRYHIVKAGPKSEFYSTDTQILYACFNLLVEHVEQELAWMERVFSPEHWGFKTGKISWFERWRFKPNKEMGLAHLKWEISECGELQQALAAKEILSLYTWWTEERSKKWEELSQVFDLWLLSKKYKEESPFVKEKQLSDEDDEMLIRLMKVRQNLWT